MPPDPTGELKLSAAGPSGGPKLLPPALAGGPKLLPPAPAGGPKLLPPAPPGAQAVAAGPSGGAQAGCCRPKRGPQAVASVPCDGSRRGAHGSFGWAGVKGWKKTKRPPSAGFLLSSGRRWCTQVFNLPLPGYLSLAGSWRHLWRRCFAFSPSLYSQIQGILRRFRNVIQSRRPFKCSRRLDTLAICQEGASIRRVWHPELMLFQPIGSNTLQHDIALIGGGIRPYERDLTV